MKKTAMTTDMERHLIERALAHPFLSAMLLLLSAMAYLLTRLVYLQFTLPHRKLPGPKSPSIIYGHLQSLTSLPLAPLFSRWLSSYPSTLAYTSIFGRYEVLTTDLRAISHIYAHPQLYDQIDSMRTFTYAITGRSLLWATGDDHKRIRRVLLPAFGTSHIRALSGVFRQKAAEVVDKLLLASSVAMGEGDEGKEKSVAIAMPLHEYTTDVIGLAGFDCDLGALAAKGITEGEGQRLLGAFRGLLAGAAPQGGGLLRLMQFAGIGGWLPTKRSRTLRQTREVMRQIGSRLISAKKAAIASETGDTDAATKADFTSRDILSLLVRANMATDLSPSQRLSDDEMLSQIPLMLLGGTFTTHAALMWSVIVLAQYPQVQEKLCAELSGLPTELKLEDLDALPYLRAFTLELLRVHSPVPRLQRKAMCDTVLPLGTPVKGRDGRMMDAVHLREGTTIVIPLVAVNHSKEIWGEDADEFKPERHLGIESHNKGGSGEHSVPGVWGGLMTFGGGERGCLGFRVALAEIKYFLHALLQRARVELPEGGLDVERSPGGGPAPPRVKGGKPGDVRVVLRRVE